MGAQRGPGGGLIRTEPRLAWRWWPIVPLGKIACAILLGGFLWSLSEIAFGSEGPWVEIGAALLAGLCALTGTGLGGAAWRRRREGLRGRAAGWGVATIAVAALGALAIVVVVTSAQITGEINGADVHATRPVLHALPVPSGARLLDERPGLAGTESITDDYQVSTLSHIPAFYRRTLTAAGWKEEPAETDLLRFQRGGFEVTILLDPTSNQYAATVDRLLPTPSPS